MNKDDIIRMGQRGEAMTPMNTDVVGQLEDMCWQDLEPGPLRIDHRKLVDLVVRDIIRTVQMKIVRNGHTPENLRSYQHVQDIADRYSIELPMHDWPEFITSNKEPQ